MFRNRGDLPNISGGWFGNDDNDLNDGYDAPHYSHYWNGRYVVVRYDPAFLAIEMVIMLILAVVWIGAYIYTYKIPFEDPIYLLKKEFIMAQLIFIGISVISTGLVTFLSCSKNMLIKALRIIGVFCLTSIIITVGVKLSIDKTYTKEKFAEYYEEFEREKSDNTKNKNKVIFKTPEFKLLDSKESYISESAKAYNIFSIKVILILIVHIAVAIVIFYLSYRVSYVEERRKRIEKDDNVVYDEEENVKF